VVNASSRRRLEPAGATEPPPDPVADGVLAQIREFRRAARLIVRAEHGTIRQKLVALVNLAERARRSAAGDLALEAVAVESLGFVRGQPREVPPTSDPVEAACRRLLSQGLIRCPTCRRSLPDERELDRWQRLRLEAIEEARRFEEAVPP
jgi:hypothetical protein